MAGGNAFAATPTFQLATTNVTLVENATARQTIDITNAGDSGNHRVTFSVAVAGDTIFSTNPAPAVSVSDIARNPRLTNSDSTGTARLYYSLLPDATGTGMMVVSLTDDTAVTRTTVTVTVTAEPPRPPAILSLADHRFNGVVVVGGHLYAARGAGSFAEQLGFARSISGGSGHLAIFETAEEFGAVSSAIARIVGEGLSSFYWIGLTNQVQFIDGVSNSAVTAYHWINGLLLSTGVNRFPSARVIVPGLYNGWGSQAPDRNPCATWAANSRDPAFTPWFDVPSCSTLREALLEFPQGLPSTPIAEASVLPAVATTITLTGFDLDGVGTTLHWGVTAPVGSVTTAVTGRSTAAQTLAIRYTPTASLSPTTLTVVLNDGDSRTRNTTALVAVRINANAPTATPARTNVTLAATATARQTIVLTGVGDADRDRVTITVTTAGTNIFSANPTPVVSVLDTSIVNTVVSAARTGTARLYYALRPGATGTGMMVVSLSDGANVTRRTVTVTVTSPPRPPVITQRFGDRFSGVLVNGGRLYAARGTYTGRDNTTATDGTGSFADQLAFARRISGGSGHLVIFETLEEFVAVRDAITRSNLRGSTDEGRYWIGLTSSPSFIAGVTAAPADNFYWTNGLRLSTGLGSAKVIAPGAFNGWGSGAPVATHRCANWLSNTAGASVFIPWASDPCDGSNGGADALFGRLKALMEFPAGLPAAAALTAQAVAGGSTIRVSGFDLNGDTLRWSVTAPDGIITTAVTTHSPGAQTLSIGYNPPPRAIPSITTLTVVLSDGNARTRNATTTIRLALPVKRQPVATFSTTVLTLPANATARQTIDLTDVGDADGDVVTIRVTTAGDNVFSANPTPVVSVSDARLVNTLTNAALTGTARLYYALRPGASGTGMMVVALSDGNGGNVTRQTITVTVTTTAPRPPVITQRYGDHRFSGVLVNGGRLYAARGTYTGRDNTTATDGTGSFADQLAFARRISGGSGHLAIFETAEEFASVSGAITRSDALGSNPAGRYWIGLTSLPSFIAGVSTAPADNFYWTNGLRLSTGLGSTKVIAPGAYNGWGSGAPVANERCANWLSNTGVGSTLIPWASGPCDGSTDALFGRIKALLEFPQGLPSASTLAVAAVGGSSTTVEVSGFDLDGDALSWSVAAPVGSVSTAVVSRSTSAQTLRITYAPPNVQTLATALTVVLSDGDARTRDTTTVVQVRVGLPTAHIAAPALTLPANAAARQTIALTNVGDTGGDTVTITVTTAGTNVFSGSPAPVVSVSSTRVISTVVSAAATATAQLYYSLLPDATGTGMMVVSFTDGTNVTRTTVTVTVTAPPSRPPVITQRFEDHRFTGVVVVGGHLYAARGTFVSNAATATIGTGNFANHRDFARRISNNLGHLAIFETGEEFDAVRNTITRSNVPGDRDIGRYWIGLTSDPRHIDGFSANAANVFRWTNGLLLSTGLGSAKVIAPGAYNGWGSNAPGNHRCADWLSNTTTGNFIPWASDDCDGANGNTVLDRIKALLEFPAGLPSTAVLTAQVTGSAAVANLVQLSGFDLDGDALRWAVTGMGQITTSVVFSNTSAAETLQIGYTAPFNFNGRTTLTVTLSGGNNQQATAVVVVTVRDNHRPTATFSDTALTLPANATARRSIALTGVGQAGGDTVTITVTTAGMNVFSANPAPVVSVSSTRVISTVVSTSATATAQLYYSLRPDATGVGMMVVTLSDGVTPPVSHTITVTVATAMPLPPVITQRFGDHRFTGAVVVGGHLYAARGTYTGRDNTRATDGTGSFAEQLGFARSISNNLGHLAIFETGEEFDAVRSTITRSNGGESESDDAGLYWIGLTSDPQFISGVSANATSTFYWVSGQYLSTGTRSSKIIAPGFYNGWGAAEPVPNVRCGAWSANDDDPDITPWLSDSCDGRARPLLNRLKALLEFPAGLPSTAALTAQAVAAGSTIRLSGFDLNGDVLRWAVTAPVGTVTTAVTSHSTAAQTLAIGYTPPQGLVLPSVTTVTVVLSDGTGRSATTTVRVSLPVTDQRQPVATFTTTRVTLPENATSRQSIALSDVGDANGDRVTITVTTAGANVFSANPAPVVSVSSTRVVNTVASTAATATAQLYYSLRPDATGVGMMVVSLSDGNTAAVRTTVTVTVTAAAQRPPAILSLDDRQFTGIAVVGGHLYAARGTYTGSDNTRATDGTGSFADQLAFARSISGDRGHLAIFETVEEFSAVSGAIVRSNTSTTSPAGAGRYWIGLTSDPSFIDGVSTAPADNFYWVSGLRLSTGLGGAKVIAPGAYNGWGSGAPAAGDRCANWRANSQDAALTPWSGSPCSGGVFDRIKALLEFPAGLGSDANLTVSSVSTDSTTTFEMAGFDLDGDALSWSVTAPIGRVTTAVATRSAGAQTLRIAYAPPANFERTNLTVVLSDGARTATTTVRLLTGALPTFRLAGTTLRVDSRDGAQTIANFVTVDNALPGISYRLSVSATTGNLFAAAPVISSAGQLSYTPAAGRSGTATVGVVLAVAGTPDVSDTQTFTIAVSNYFSGGSGTQQDPYLLRTASELVNVAQRSSSAFRLNEDITLGGAWRPIGAFSGRFDGNDRRISGLQVATASEAGLFGVVSGAANIERLTIVLAGAVTGSRWAGAVAGRMTGGTVSSVTVVATTPAGRIALTGSATDAAAGGLVGYADGAVVITRSISRVSVSGGLGSAGGLVGQSSGAVTIRESYATGTVSGGNGVGGLVGSASGTTVSDSYALMDTSGSTAVGGLIGGLSTRSVRITAAYADGAVTAASTGGYVLGAAPGSSLTTVYYNRGRALQVATTVTAGAGVDFSVDGTNTASFEGLSTAVWSFASTQVRRPLLRFEGGIPGTTTPTTPPTPTTPTTPVAGGGGGGGCTLVPTMEPLFDPLLLLMLAATLWILLRRLRRRERALLQG